jgi:cyclophilin family peptidyl-prolyl cis-trans isomerase
VIRQFARRRIRLLALRASRQLSVFVFTQRNLCLVLFTYQQYNAVCTVSHTGDGNGGSSQFFWLTDSNLEEEGVFMKQAAENLDSRYSIFAYVTTNRTQVLSQVCPGNSNAQSGTYYIDKVAVTYGADNLVRTRAATFRDLLLNKNGGDEDD